MFPTIGSTVLVTLALAGLAIAAPAATSPYAPCTAKTSLCFGFPDNCVASANCQILFRSHWSSGLNIDLIGSGIAANEYVAVGFSNLTKMSGLVVGCYHTAASNNVHFSVNAYVEKHHNTDITNQRDILGFTNLKSSVTGTQLTCSLQVPKGTKVKYQDIEFDFENQKYYVQLARGPLKDGKLSYHGKNHIVSSTPLNLKV